MGGREHRGLRLEKLDRLHQPIGVAGADRNVAQADPICAAANADIARLDKKFLRLDKNGRNRAAGAALGNGDTSLCFHRAGSNHHAPTG